MASKENVLLGKIKGFVIVWMENVGFFLLDTVYNNIRSLIIGKMYSSSDLAYYDQGKSFQMSL